jgi:hypothetical protein
MLQKQGQEGDQDQNQDQEKKPGILDHEPGVRVMR